jgi:hypothetical protein
MDAACLRPRVATIRATFSFVQDHTAASSFSIPREKKRQKNLRVSFFFPSLLRSSHQIEYALFWIRNKLVSYE